MGNEGLLDKVEKILKDVLGSVSTLEIRMGK